MANEVFDQWMTDLESGEFKQGKEWLSVRSDETGELEHCCLGVLCWRLAQQGKIEMREEGGIVTYGKDLDGPDCDYSDKVLPRKVVSLLGLHTDEIPEVTDEAIALVNPDLAGTIFDKGFASLNDVHGFTFKEIATVAKATWGSQAAS